MKWKRSRKAKEQAAASGQPESERLRGGKQGAVDKSEPGSRPATSDDRDDDLELEEGEEDEDEDDMDDMDDMEDSQCNAFPVGMGDAGAGLPRPVATDFLPYNPHSPFSEDGLDGVPVGGDRKIKAGL